jgi:L-ascorbate metabolism protein UlaG (beta-lactamase superfamily)
MTLLGREAILAADDLPSEDVDVPEWGGTVRVQGLSGKARDEYFTSMAVIRGGQVVGQDTRNTSARLVAQCLVGEDGQTLFTPGDIDLLGAKSAAALGRVFEVAARLSGLEESDVKSLGEDSAPTLNGATTST